MTPKEKAKELIEKFMSHINECEHYTEYLAKSSAIVCAQEVRESHPMYTGNLNPKWKFWNDVVTELLAL